MPDIPHRFGPIAALSAAPNIAAFGVCGMPFELTIHRPVGEVSNEPDGLSLIFDPDLASNW